MLGICWHTLCVRSAPFLGPLDLWLLSQTVCWKVCWRYLVVGFVCCVHLRDDVVSCFVCRDVELLQTLCESFVGCTCQQTNCLMITDTC